MKYYFLIAFCWNLVWIRTTSLRHDPLLPLLPDYQPYHYTSLPIKMQESMSSNNCSMTGSGWTIPTGFGGEMADVRVEIRVPPKDVQEKWGSLHHEKHLDEPLYFYFSTDLCGSKLFSKLRKGHFKAPKGCWDLYDRNGGKVYQGRHGATLHPNHPRCEIQLATAVCDSKPTQPVAVRREEKMMHEYPFVVIPNEGVIVARSGMLALPCGPIGLLASCEAYKWGMPAAASVVKNVEDCRRGHCMFASHKKIFVMSQYDDTQIGQFMHESLPRLIYHLEYLLANPDIMIHYGFTKKPKVPKFTLPNYYFSWLGLEQRIINGTFYAERAMLTREGGCQDVSYATWEIVTLRETFLQLTRSGEYHDMKQFTDRQRRVFGGILDALPQSLKDTSGDEGPPVVLVVQRTWYSAFVQNQMDQDVRTWSNKTANQITRLLARRFPDHEIATFRDSDHPLMSCPPCQIRLFSRAEIVIGIHGAGLTNTIYMRRGGVVVEALPHLDSRHPPITGIFARSSALIGLHHFSYLLAEKEFDPKHFVKEIAHFYKNVTTLSGSARRRA